MQVIYHLNSQNEDHGFELEAAKKHHREEIEAVTADAAAKLKRLKDQLESRREQVTSELEDTTTTTKGGDHSNYVGHDDVNHHRNTVIHPMTTIPTIPPDHSPIPKHAPTASVTHQLHGIDEPPLDEPPLGEPGGPTEPAQRQACAREEGGDGPVSKVQRQRRS